MPNDFEKQVQRKMEELNFVPSEPVWTNIEKQIRKKKDRRRMILWLPLFFLLSGFGLWYFYNGSELGQGAGSTVHQLSKNKSGDDGNRTGAQALAPYNHSTNTSEEKSTRKANETSSENTETLKNSRSIASGARISGESTKKSASFAGKPRIVGNRERSLSKKDNPAGLNKKSNGEKTSFPDNNKTDRDLATLTPSLKHSGSKSTRKYSEDKSQPIIAGQPNYLTSDNLRHFPISIPYPFGSNVEKTGSVVPAPGNIVHEERSELANVNKEESKSNSSRWSWGLTAGAGFSGVSNGVHLFPYMASLDAGPGTWPTYASYGGPAPTKEGFSFTAGMSIKRQLGKRISLSTGLEYLYFGNSIRVGAKLYRDTVINASVVNRGAFLDARYSISNNVSLSPTYIDYRNQYHFLSLPLTMDVQILRKIPLDFQLGLSLQQLISSKALHYESRTGVYYEDKSALHKTQLFGHLGLNYSVLRNRSLQVGPEIQYGLSRLEKSGTNQHLFSYGVKARYLIKFK